MRVGMVVPFQDRVAGLRDRLLRDTTDGTAYEARCVHYSRQNGHGQTRHGQPESAAGWRVRIASDRGRAADRDLLDVPAAVLFDQGEGVADLIRAGPPRCERAPA